MAVLTCSQGHRWPIETTRNGISQPRCPQCGSAGTITAAASEPTLDIPSSAFQVQSVQAETLTQPGSTPEFTITQTSNPPPVNTKPLTAELMSPSAAEDPFTTLAAPAHPTKMSPTMTPLDEPDPTSARDAPERHDGTRQWDSEPPIDVTRPSEKIAPTDRTREVPSADARYLAALSGKSRGSKIPKIPGYEILDELGRGGMGVVYKARQLGLNRLVALKMILAGARASHQELARFKIEAEASAKLKHPNIVQVYEVGDLDGCPYFSLEFLEGDCLAKKVAGTPQPPKEAAQLIQQLALAMDFAHRQNVIHRDLKPANILLSAEGTPKITDFGLAKQIDDEDSGNTRTGAILGTPSYMAPEQAEGKTKEAGPAADIYSLGAMLYDLLVGRPPFKGATVLDTLQQVRTVEPVPLTRILNAIPKDLETICLKCLQKDPAKRYATAGLLAEDLQRYLVGEPILARPTPVYERVWKWTRRRPAAAALIGLSAAVILGLAIGGPIVAVDQNQLKRRAEKGEQEAIEAKERAIAAQIEAENQADRAVVNRKDAEGALQQVSYLAVSNLDRMPGFKSLRRKLLEDNLRFYDRMLKREGDNPTFLGDRAMNLVRLGDILEQLGDHSQSEKTYSEALAVFDTLDPIHLKSPVFRTRLALCKRNVGILLLDQGKRAEAVKAIDEAIRLGELATAEEPENLEYLQELAKARGARALLFQMDNQPSDAEQQYKLALAMFGQLAKKAAQEISFASNWVNTQNNLAVLLQTMGRPREAEAAYKAAIKGCQSLRDHFPGWPDFRFEMARGKGNLGALYERSFLKANEAYTEYQEAIKLLEGLLVGFPGRDDFPHELAIVYGNLAHLLVEANQLDAAEKNLGMSLRILEGLLTRTPDAVEYRAQQSRNLMQLALVQDRKKKYAEAEKTLERSHNLQKELRKEFPDNPAYQQDEARMVSNFGLLMIQTQKPGKAVDYFQQAADSLGDLAKRYSQTPAYKEEWITQLTNLAHALIDLSRWQDGIDQFKRASKLAEELTRDFPKNPDYAGQSGLVLIDWSGQLLEHEQFSEAVPLLRKAIQEINKALAAQPQHPKYWQGSCVAHLFLMQALVKLEKPAEAASVGLELVKVMPGDWSEISRIAKWFAQCVPLVDRDRALSSAQREERKKSYTEQTIALIRKGLAMKTIVLTYVTDSADLDPLRERPEFKQFLAELGKMK